MTDKQTLSDASIDVIRKIAAFVPEKEIYAELKNVYDDLFPMLSKVATDNNWDIPEDIMALIARAYTPTIYQMGIAYACNTGIMGIPEELMKDICSAILESLDEAPQAVLNAFIEEHNG